MSFFFVSNIISVAFICNNFKLLYSVEMGISVYIADVQPLLTPEVFERLVSHVPAYRQAKARRFKFPSGRAQSLAVGLLLKKACEDFGIAGADEHVVFGENGKPEFADVKDFHFNLSHSHERAMCVISPYEVGCDVELVEHEKMRLAERFFTSEECSWISKQGDDRAFYRIWTLKESYMKVTGLGMSLAPDSFVLRFDEKGGISVYRDGARSEYFFSELNKNDGYCYAYCIKTAEKKDIVNKIKANFVDFTKMFF